VHGGKEETANPRRDPCKLRDIPGVKSVLRKKLSSRARSLRLVVIVWLGVERTWHFGCPLPRNESNSRL